MSESARDMVRCPACGEGLWHADELFFDGDEYECTACETRLVVKSDIDDETREEFAYIDEVHDE